MGLPKTESERIAAAEAWARQIMDKNPEAVARLGESNVLSDLTHEYLMNTPPSEELAKQMGLTDGDADAEFDKLFD